MKARLLASARVLAGLSPIATRPSAAGSDQAPTALQKVIAMAGQPNEETCRSPSPRSTLWLNCVRITGVRDFGTRPSNISMSVSKTGAPGRHMRVLCVGTGRQYRLQTAAGSLR